MSRTLLGYLPLPLLAVLTAAIVLALASRAFYTMEILILAIIYAQFAASWDLLSGFTDQDSFGHAFFIGGTAYLSALLGQWLNWSPWITAPAASIVAAFIGSLIGTMTLRLRGPYFALSTIAIAAVLYKLAYVLSGMTGGEEGLSGLRSFTDNVSTDLLTCVLIFTISFLGMQLLCRSRFGLILRSTKHNEDAAQATGINTAYYKVLAFTLSGFLAGLGGAMYGHTQMQVNPELLAGSLSVMIVLLAIVGGRGTIVGPAIAAIVLTVLDEWLRIVDQYRGVIFTGTLIALVYANPAGFANSPFLSRYGRLRRLLFGSRISA